MRGQKPGLLRQVRQALNRLRALGGADAPDAPALSCPPPWPGDPMSGVRLVKGELEYGGAVMVLDEDVFAGADATRLFSTHLHGFAWLRDLHALGTDAARSAARTFVLDYLDTPRPDPLTTLPEVAGARLSAWLGYYDFFAASADDDFRQLLMHRLVLEARALAAGLPPEAQDGGVLTAYKGLAAAAVAMPEHAPYMPRLLKFLPAALSAQFFADGCHIERSPAAHLAALRDLIELRTLLKAASVPVPSELSACIERAACALRALRHGDGGLALFNGTVEDSLNFIDLVLGQAGRVRGTMGHLSPCRLYRLAAAKSLLFFDSGNPPPPGLDRFAHAGTLSFEFSVGKERIVTNCGAAPVLANGWAEALRGTAAHSTLCVNDVSSSEITPLGLTRRPDKVEARRHEEGGVHWLEGAHDGWQILGSVHRRCVGLASSGDELLGFDFIEGTPQPFAIRFHLHPGVTASPQEDASGVLLRTASGLGFRFKAEGAEVAVEESVYFGGAEPRRSTQIVLAGHQDGPQQVRWSFTKV
jgi:uncharacterized heparinase superfamily protein